MGNYIEKIKSLKESNFINEKTFDEFKNQYKVANEFIQAEMDRLSFFLDAE